MLGGVVWTLSVAALLLLDPAHPRVTQVTVISTKIFLMLSNVSARARSLRTERPSCWARLQVPTLTPS